MIHSINCVVPGSIVDRWEIERRQLQSFEHSTGIYATRKTNLSSTVLATKAVEAALKHIPDPGKIRIILTVTQTPTMRAPCTSLHVMDKLKALPQNCIAFDVNQACGGYVYGLHIANSLLAMEQDADAIALVVCVDKLEIDGTVLEKLIFSDAASCTVMSYQKNLHGTFINDTRGVEHLYMHQNGNLIMHGAKVYEFVTENMPRLITEHGTGCDVVIAHQANELMLKTLEKRTGKTMPRSISQYGNASMNTLPLTLVTHADMVRAQPKVLLCGFGAGWSAALMQVTINPETVMELQAT